MTAESSVYQTKIFKIQNTPSSTLCPLISIPFIAASENKRRGRVDLGVAAGGCATEDSEKEGEKLISSFAFPKKREFKGSGADYRAATSDLTTVCVILPSPDIYVRPVENGENDGVPL